MTSDTPLAINDDPKLIPAWKELVKVASGWDMGSIHEHSEIAEILGIKYRTPKYYQYLHSAMKELTTIGKRIVNINKRGYYVLKPGEQTKEVVGDFKKSTKKAREAVGNWHCSAVDKMDDAEKRTNEHVGIAGAKVFSALSNGYTEMAQIAGVHRKQKVLAGAANKKRGKEEGN